MLEFGLGAAYGPWRLSGCGMRVGDAAGGEPVDGVPRDREFRGPREPIRRPAAGAARGRGLA